MILHLSNFNWQERDKRKLVVTTRNNHNSEIVYLKRIKL